MLWMHKESKLKKSLWKTKNKPLFSYIYNGIFLGSEYFWCTNDFNHGTVLQYGLARKCRYYWTGELIKTPYGSCGAACHFSDPTSTKIPLENILLSLVYPWMTACNVYPAIHSIQPYNQARHDYTNPKNKTLEAQIYFNGCSLHMIGHWGYWGRTLLDDKAKLPLIGCVHLPLAPP